jgi:Zn-finger nucleic acid-binding protein
MTERLNIEIDYCPQCRGVWLDRGELDKIIERSQQQEPPRFLPKEVAQSYQEVPPVEYGYNQPTSSHHGSKHGHGEQSKSHGGGWRESGHKTEGHGQQSYRKKSFLREIFD